MVAMQDKTYRLVGMLGGTFDPIHYGHLRTAMQIKTIFAMHEMCLVPCHKPPHRDAPVGDAQRRLQMATLAVAQSPGLSIDARELEREGPSYSIDTLTSMRQELDEQTAICMLLGMDAFLGLPSWHRWRELLSCCHIIVMTRPGWQDRHADGYRELDALMASSRVENTQQLCRFRQGKIIVQEVAALDISATMIRDRIAQGLPVQGLTPDSVIQYIRQQGLFQSQDVQ